MKGDERNTPFLLVTTAVVAGGLAVALATWRKSKHDSYLETSEGVVTHRLSDSEKPKHLQDERPITMLIWFCGDYRKAALILQTRGAHILEHNPWLGGRVRKIGGELFLTYNNGNDTSFKPYNFVQDHFCLVEPDKSPLSRSLPVGNLSRAFKGFFLTNGSSQPLFRVTIVPCRENAADIFAVVVAVSHLVADGYTFYRIHNMLCSQEEVVSLNPERLETMEQQQRVTVGETEAGYGSSVGLMVGMLRCLFLAIVVGPAAGGKFTLVDSAKMSERKREAAEASNVPFVSANDVITSWFLQNCKCQYGFMTVNLRNRVAGHTDRHAGNYVNGIFYTRSDSASAGLVHQSLSTLKRTVTKEMPMPSFW